MFKAGRKFGLLIGSVLLSVLAIEGLLKISTDPHFLEGEPIDGFEWMRLDPVIGWRNCSEHWAEDFDKEQRMAWTKANINSLGFRGPELPVAKTEGEARIAFLGDSTTFGVLNKGWSLGSGSTSNGISRASWPSSHMTRSKVSA